MLYITPTIFHDITLNIDTYGFRIFDETHSYYDNSWVEMPDAKDWLKILDLVCTTDDSVIQELIDESFDNKAPIMIGNRITKYDEYKEVL